MNGPDERLARRPGGLREAHRRRGVGSIAVGGCLLALACRAHPDKLDKPPSELSGGALSVFDATQDAFSLPAPGLSDELRRQFFVGNSFFNQNWVEAPSSVSSRDGLGPLFNARSCSACHFKDGRSRPPLEAGEPLSTMLVRISARAAGDPSVVRPDPVYGGQIQGNAAVSVAKEADVFVDYTERSGRFPDGELYRLAVPRYRLEHLGYGPTAPNPLISPRVAPVMIGLGLLEAIPEATLAALSDPDDRDGDGISGRINRVWDESRKVLAAGRFGWKAEQPSVFQQSAGAFLHDMGLTSTVFPKEAVTEGQPALLALPSGGEPEVTPDVLEAVSNYARLLAVPVRRNLLDPCVVQGEERFGVLGCAACHVPALETAPDAELPELRAQRIQPYTDLLLHDLGEGLSDHRPVLDASGSEWRTPPLWGIGLVSQVNGHTRFLHDGRARNLEEAILWHGGEATRAREGYVKSRASERRAVLCFLESL